MPAVMNKKQDTELLRAVLETVMDGIISIDDKGTVETLNPAAEKIFGYVADEIIGNNVSMLMPEPFHSEHDDYLADYLRTGQTKAIGIGRAVKGLRKNGSTFPMRIAVTEMNFQGKRKFVGAIRDTSEYERAEKAAKKAHEQLSDAIESISDGIVLLDVDDCFILCNEKYREDHRPIDHLLIAGTQFEEIIRALAKHGIALGAVENVEDWVQERMEKHRTLSSHEPRQEIGGRWIMVHEYRTREGGTLVLRTDMSELQKTQDDLIIAKDTAEAANRAKSAFLASMSHELRTPMNAILGFTQMLQYNSKEPLTETQKESVKHALTGGNHLLKLIDELLDLSKIEAGQLSLTVDHILARQVIDECLLQVQARAEKNNLEIIDTTLENDLPLLWTDETRLKQVLLNLLSNAVKYNRVGGTVTVSSREMSTHMLRISVEDTGQGIPADKQENVFIPFDRLGREAKTVEGTGIGLAIAKQIIEVLGGAIDFKSEEGEGSTFWIDVPLSERQDTGEAYVKMAKSNGKMLKKLSNTDSRRPVLYVEDDPANIKLMEMIFGHFTDIKLLTTHNAELGLELAKEHKPVLILIDINLPSLGELEVLKKFQGVRGTKYTPVIAIGSAAMSKDVVAGSEAGFNAYITKPINVQETLQIIEHQLGKAYAEDCSI